MQTKFSQHMMSEINVTPLVDVMLVLLIIFIVTAPLLLQAVPVKLPKTVAGSPPPPTKNLQLSITAEGKLLLDQRAVTLAELPSQLQQLAQGNNDLAVQLHADAEVSYGKLAQVMALVQQAGITRLAFVTTPE